MMIPRRKRTIVFSLGIFVWIFFGMCVRAFAQDYTAHAPPFFTVTGNVTLTADFYNAASADSAQSGRRPPSLYRLLFSPTLNFDDVLSIPLNIVLTAPGTNTLTPGVQHPTLAQFFESPANALGFSTLAPKIGWAQFYLGTQSPSYSPLTAGDVPLFGAGFDLTPGEFRFAFSIGTTQRAVAPDSTNNYTGAYRRDEYMARIAYGKEDSTFVGVNFVFAKDALNSLGNNNVSVITPAHSSPADSTVIVPADTNRLQAQEGFVMSTNFQVLIEDGMYVSSELAVSSFTNDETAPAVPLAGNPFSFLSPPLASTRVDFAGTAAFTLKRELWGVKLSGLYMGAGFMPIGYAYTQPDKIEVSAAPYFHLFDNKLSLAGSLGDRVNDISGTLATKTTQITASANVSADVTDALNLSAQYSNFGVHNDQSSDTLKVQTISQAFSFTPTLTLQGETVTQVLTASFSLDQFMDYNVVSGDSNYNNTRTLLASYTSSFTGIPLTASVLGSYMENRLTAGTLIVRSFGLNLGYAFFDKKLASSLSATSSGSTTADGQTDTQLFYKIAFTWHATTAVDISANAGNNFYTYNNPLPTGSTFAETLIQLAVNARF